MKYLLYYLVKIILLLVLPFIFLIRGSVYLHTQHHFYPSMALLGGIIATMALLVIYFSYFYGRMTGKFGSFDALKRRSLLAVVILAVYCINGLLFLSGNNAKTDEVQKEYRSLHPILRLSISTIVYLDKDLILTDASRVPEDYRKMGLKTKRASLHYKQSSGYVHAFDVRTKNQSEVRNFLLKWYFKLMGFNTLRHGGTGDHLHISLLSHDNPQGI